MVIFLELNFIYHLHIFHILLQKKNHQKNKKTNIYIYKFLIKKLL